MSEITIIKRSHRGETLIEYSGDVVARGETWVCVRATFNHDDKIRDYVAFRRGDIFYEWHYADRWYNVFEMHDVTDGHFKGWYCNVTRPARITDSTVAADDLALDAFISPDGAMLVLDEDEFAALDLSDDERRHARHAIEQIRGMVERRAPPFSAEP